MSRVVTIHDKVVPLQVATDEVNKYKNVIENKLIPTIKNLQNDLNKEVKAREKAIDKAIELKKELDKAKESKVVGASEISSKELLDDITAVLLFKNYEISKDKLAEFDKL